MRFFLAQTLKKRDKALRGQKVEADLPVVGACEIMRKPLFVILFFT